MSNITYVNSASLNSLRFTLDATDNDINKIFDLIYTTGLGNQIESIIFFKRDVQHEMVRYLPHVHRRLRLPATRRYIPLDAVINIKTDTLVATTTTGSIVDDGNDNVYVVTTGLSIVDPLAGQFGRVMLKCNKPTVRALKVSNLIDNYGVYKGHNDIRSRIR